MNELSIGSIVSFRNREWVLLPSDQSEVLLLRPLTGATDDVVAVHRRLSDLVGYSFPEERVKSAAFPLPTANDVSDAASAHLLWQAARLNLREGAAPFRSLGRISIRPRTYQFVPLMMALRLDPVRLLIADDVGVGKTIEALLIVRELLDRGEIKRFCVLCPPYLCEQWQKELSEKFNLESIIVRSGALSQLDRAKSGSESIYKYYPVQVISIDFVKLHRNKHLFLLDCPELVIVDEAHGSAIANERNVSQHQRHELVTELLTSTDRHLILLTATPHSGIETTFRSLLGFLDPEFARWNTSDLDEPQRIRLAQNFVQRTRKDIEKDWEGGQCFPKRDASDEHYHLSRANRELFEKTYVFCTEMVRSSQDLEKRHQRVRYWAALALLRCVMSSPAAALAALERRKDTLPDTEDEVEFRQYVFESTNEQTDDTPPVPPVESAERTLPDSERRKLKDLVRLAESITHTPDDTKLVECGQLVGKLLERGFHPIVWCRYIATADYVAEGLQGALRLKFPEVRIIAISGKLGDDERRAKVDELAQEKRRVLVATDCLSEGINLQKDFNAAIHYDLPWNPNRLEQREGRVDRYGQTSLTVKTIRYFSPDSPVDGVVIEVLLNKAREIHRVLGTHVPVPEESESVTEAVFNALFLRGQPMRGEGPLQLQLGLKIPEVATLHRKWELDAERERVNRTRFAQRALKPEEVRRELEATDDVLGDSEAVRLFVLNAAQRIALPIVQDQKKPNVYRVIVGPEVRVTLPDAISFALPETKSSVWLLSFVSPTPEGTEYVGRNHRFVTALAQFLMEEALTKEGNARAARCGVIRTKAVDRLTTLYLLRIRYLVQQPNHLPLLSEEVEVVGKRRTKGDSLEWLDQKEAFRLLVGAMPDANVPMPEKRELVSKVLSEWDLIQPDLVLRLAARAEELRESHRRIRQAVSMKVRSLAVQPQLPPDLLGVLVLQPLVKS